MTTKIKKHLHYCNTLTMRVFATFEEAVKDAKFQKELYPNKYKRDACKFVKVCFIHSLNDSLND